MSIARRQSRVINRQIENKEITELNRSNYSHIRKGAKASNIELLLNNPKSKDAFLLNLFPKDSQNVRKNKNFIPETDLEQEITWHYLLVKKYVKYILLFIDRKEEFEKQFFSGNYKEAKEILKDVEQNICISDWGIEMDILTTYRDIGHDSRYIDYINYIRHMRELYSKNSPNYWLIHLQALRTEMATSVRGNSFNEEFKSVIDSQHECDKGFYNYKIDFYNCIQKYSEISLIQTEDSSSIIDRYETLIFIIQYYLCKTSNNTPSRQMCQLIKDLYSITKDSRLSNTMLYLGYAENINLKQKDVEYCKLIDMYTTHNYEESKEYAKKMLVKYPNLFDLYKIYSLSCIYTNSDIGNVFVKEKCLGQMALNNIFNALRKKEDISDNINTLKNFYLSLGRMSWAVKCCTFINNESSIYTKDFRYRLFSALYDNVFYPRIIRHINKKERLHAIIKSPISKINKNINFILYIQAKCHEFNDLHIEYSPNNEFREKIIYAQVLKTLKKYAPAYEIYNEISVSTLYTSLLELPHNYIKLIHGKMRCLVELERYNEALTLVTNTILEYPNYFLKLKYITLLRAIKNDPTKEIKRNICTPIYLHFCHEDDNSQWPALGNFMSENKINHPHEISSLQEFTIETKKHLLRYVCNKNVIKFHKYKTNKEVLEECIKIQNVLIDIDKNNTNYYSNNIISLIMENEAKQTRSALNQGKIRVNIEGLKQDNRYEGLRRKYSPLIELLCYTKFTSKNRDENFNVIEKLISVSFKQMFLEIKNIFVFDNNFGFNLYLGTRIRHGWIQTALRAIFEKYKLITIVDSETNKYLDNDKWGNLSLHDNFQGTMSSFSFAIDETIDELYKRVLRIKTNQISVALFDYDFNEENIKSVENNVWSRLDNFNNDSFDIVFDVIVDELKIRSIQNIEQVKSYISDVSLKKMLQKLDDLTTAMETLSGVQTKDLKDIKKHIISCKDEVQKRVIEINSWFSFSQDTDIEPFSIKDIILACQNALYNHINFKPVIVDDKVKEIKGKHFHSICDIFQILLNNAIKHSGLKNEDILIEIKINESNEYLKILVENNLSKFINIEEQQENIDLILVEAKDIDETKNSGLARIKKLIENELEMKEPRIFCQTKENNTGCNTITFIIEIKKENIYSYENIVN